MIPRIRPLFSPEYLTAFRRYDPDVSRQQIVRRLSTFLKTAYPSAKGFEFFDEGRKSLGVALELVGARQGDEIVLSAFTCPSVLEPIRGMGLSPVLVNPRFDFTMDPIDVQKVVSARTKAIIVTHVFGIQSNVLEIKEIADRAGIPVIEDCAQIFCSPESGSGPGSVGDIAFTSHKNDKPLSLGRGSTLIVNNDALLPDLERITAQRVATPMQEEMAAFLSLLFFYLHTDPARYTSFIGGERYFAYFMTHPSEQERIVHQIMEGGSDLTSFADVRIESTRHFPAVTALFGHTVRRFFRRSESDRYNPPRLVHPFSLHILAEALRYIGPANKKRRALGALYHQNLGNSAGLYLPEDRDTPYLRFPVISKDPKRTSSIVHRLRASGFEVGNFNWTPSLSRILHTDNGTGRATFIAENIINLPCHPDVRDEDIARIGDVLTEADR